MQYFNPNLLRKHADSVEGTLRKEGDSRQNDNFNAFDPLSENYGISNAVEDISSWWGGQGDKSAAAGNRALTYFTPRLVGSLGLAAVVSLLAGRKGGIMPALIGAVAGWFLGEPAMRFFQRTFGSKSEDVTKRTEEAKKGNSVEEADGDNKSKPYTPKNLEGGNEQQPQQPQQPAPQQPSQQPAPQPQQPAPQPQSQPQQSEQPAEDPQGPVQQEPIPPEPIPQQPADIPQEQPTDEDELIRAQGGEIPTTGGNPVEDPAAYGLSEDAPASGMTEQPVVGQPAEDPTAGEAPNMAGQIKGKVEAAAGGVKQAGGKLLDMLHGKQQPMSRPQNPTEAREQTQQPQPPQQPQQPQMTAEEWQQQVQDRMRGPWSSQKSPEMQFHEYAYNIPEKTAPSYSYLGLSRKPSQAELAQAYPEDMVREYATSTPFGRYKSPDELRQEMYSNDQRGLMAGRKPQGRLIQADAPAGKFTLKRNEVYNDLLRQYRGQPKVGPYRQN